MISNEFLVKRRKKQPYPWGSKVEVTHFDSMEHAKEKLITYSSWSRVVNVKQKVDSVTQPMMNGLDEVFHEHVMNRSEELAREAIELDPDLARRSRMTRSDDGFEAVTDLLASGDERCMINRRRSDMTESSPGEPVNVVVSTDSNNISLDRAAALVACIRLAQQFRPINVWWQGAWIHTKENESKVGHVFIVPLVQGDIDYRRIMFVIGSSMRDTASLGIVTQVMNTKRTYMGYEPAEHSYRSEDWTERWNDHFIEEQGLTPDPRWIVPNARMMAGMTRFHDAPSGYEARQTWRPERPPEFIDELTKESNRAENLKYQERMRKSRSDKARQRMEAI